MKQARTKNAIKYKEYTGCPWAVTALEKIKRLLKNLQFLWFYYL